MIKLSERKCFEELMTLISVEGPFLWPIDMSKNWYSEVVHFATQHSPTTLSSSSSKSSATPPPASAQSTS